MARPKADEQIRTMLEVMRVVGEHAPADKTLPGTPLPLAELAREVGRTPEQTKRAIRLLNDCGEVMPGYFVDFDEKAGVVTPWRMDVSIDKPLGLTPSEAQGLLTALDAMGVEHDDPLFSQLAGAFPPITRELVSGMEMQAESVGLARVLGTLTQAVAESRVVRMGYRGLADAEPREREVEPLRLTYDAGESAWYLLAWSRERAGWRNFRADRMEDVRLTNERFRTRVAGEGASSLEEALCEAPRATLVMHDPTRMGEPEDWRGLARVEDPAPADAALLTEQDVARGGYVASIPWLAQTPLLARRVVSTLGAVEAVRPPELRTQVKGLAEELLTRLKD